MRFVQHRTFERQYKKLSDVLRDKIWERLALLLKEESNPLLSDHKLNPPWDGYRSINISGDYRLIYRELDEGVFYLRAVGTHHQLFGT